jgi:chromosomal replication initiator protein
MGNTNILVSEAEDVWAEAVDQLRSQLSDAAWNTWFSSMKPLRLDNNVLALAVPNSLTKSRLEARFRHEIESAINEVVETPTSIEFVVVDPQTLEIGDFSSEIETIDLRDNAAIVERTAPIEPVEEADDTQVALNPAYRFDTFVIGASNRFAHAAALSVAENPARSYNPLFIHGDAGLGKTHLLHAIGNYIRENFPGRKVRYVSTETFMNDFVDAIRNNSTIAFKRRYRECDVLLVDDIQFMENKEGLQEEFFHTFNSLYGANKQIVISSDRHAKALTTLEDRLRSRFLSGLITDVQPPELETRLAILHQKAQRENSQIPDDVLVFIAENVRDNIRELEGALIRVSAYASLNHQPLTRELAEEVLVDIVANTEPRQITPDVILKATSDMFGFSIEELQGPSRRRPLVTARQISMYVFRELTDASYPAIAREFGGRDHTTVIHAVEKISTQMKERRTIYDQVTQLIQSIKTGDI